MKEVVEEGMQVFLGNRLRVSLADCSLKRLEHMLEQLDTELERLGKELEKAEAEVLALYESADDVILEYSAGQYQFPLDHYRERLVDLRTRIEDLFEKRKPIYSAFQEKYLEEAQAKILKSKKAVKLKDRFIFGLIIMVLSLLAVDAGNIGATGIGAELEAVVRNGSVKDVKVINGGIDYKAARISAIAIPEKNGKGLELVAEVSADGRIANVKILGEGGTGYSDNLELKVTRILSSDTRNLFWIIDFICCLIFLANFFFELRLADSKRWYWKTHWIDFVTSTLCRPRKS